MTNKILLNIFAIILILSLAAGAAVIFNHTNNGDDTKEQGKDANQLLKESKLSELNLSAEQKKALRDYGKIGKSDKRIVYVFVDLHCADCQNFAQNYHKKLSMQKDLSYQTIPAPILGPESEKLARKQMVLYNRSAKEGNDFTEKSLMTGSADSSIEDFNKKEVDMYHNVNPRKMKELFDIEAVPHMIYKEGNKYYSVNSK